MTYYDKYHCINCPVEKYCGTMVGSIRLCHSYREENTKSILSLSNAVPDGDE